MSVVCNDKQTLVVFVNDEGQPIDYLNLKYILNKKKMEYQ